MSAKVLVVDDEVNQGRALALGLRLEGFEVTTALDAEAALASLLVSPADIAIVDLMLPGINGIELARRLTRLYPKMRVVLTSAYHLSERQLLRADCGVVGFVPKPYRLDELAEFLRAKLASSPESARQFRRASGN
ncbi:response regulator [Pendulispora albinea]|uniref:Response regulator n=1 Tax=Pendulispora albinea TaxID=2741071 RepID=A0ABZ2M5T9_9BACT